MGADIEKEIEEDRLVVWWSPDLNQEDVFVMPVVTIEEGVKTLGLLASYDDFLTNKEFREKCPSNGELAFLTPEGELKPWSYVSIADGGIKYDDPMEYLKAKYAKTAIIT
jgi:hypothetical protein